MYAYALTQVTMSWDLNLCMSWDPHILVPFYYFARPVPWLSTTSPHQHFPFLRLPIDLQLLVYEKCDAATLFQLMRTCSHTRGPATKLFWGNESTEQFYFCSQSGLFEHSPYHHVIIKHCPEFAQRITRVEIYFARIEMHFDTGDGSLPGNTDALMKAQAFWVKVSKVFPSLNKVVLSGLSPADRNWGSFPELADDAWATIEAVVECAPSYIAVCIALADDKTNGLGTSRKPKPTTLWQVASHSHPKWQIIEAGWKPKRVLLPTRKWATSPLGDFLTLKRGYDALHLEWRGLQWLMMESYVRYSVKGVIHCPLLGCDATLRHRDLWNQHVFHHDTFSLIPQDHMLELWCYKHTPSAERKVIEARRERLKERHQELERLERRIGYGWGPRDSEQRRTFEKQFAMQLKEENFFAPGDLATATPDYPLGDFADWLAVYYDRTHIYHRCFHGCPGPDREHICYN